MLRRVRPALRTLFAMGAVCAPSLGAQRTLSDLTRTFVSVGDEVVALVGVRVIDGTGSPAQDNRTVLMRGNRIEAVGPVASVAIPAGARRLDLAGHTVIPGYVMLHEHTFYGVGRNAYNQMEYSFPKLYLAGGATTIRTGGTRDPYGDLTLREQIDAGAIPGPRMHVTGPYITGPGFPVAFLHSVKNAEEARRMVRYWSDEGATSFKVYQHITRDELRATIEEAHARGIKVTGHICSVTFGEAADLGIDNLEHGFQPATDFVEGKQPDQCPGGGAGPRSVLALDVNGPAARGLIKHLIDRGVALTSTLTVWEAGVPGRPMAYQGVLDAMVAPIRDQYLRQWASIQQQKNSTSGALLTKLMALEKAFVDAGGLLVAGTDPTSYGGVMAGFANQRQVELLREAGFTTEQAIQISTSNGAKYLGVADQLGTVAPGKLADLVVLQGDPTADITVVQKVRYVFKDGIGYDPEKLKAAVAGVVGLY